MKKAFARLIAILILIVIEKNSFSQWQYNGNDIYYNAGRVGIGTTAPTKPLHVISSSAQSSGQNSSADIWTYQTSSTTGNVMSLGSSAKTTHSTGIVSLSVSGIFNGEHNGAGNVANMRGVQGGAWISGSGTVSEMTALYGNLSITGSGSATNGYGLYISNFPNGITNKWGVYVSDPIAKNYFSGSVCINTTSDYGYKLAVNGSAIFTEAKIKLYANWPDYVFEKKYPLLPIRELEIYVKSKKHLPNIPSAEFIKSQEGFEIGNMTIKLLEKIEELTLYVIDLKKENDQIRKDLDKLFKK